MRRGRLAGLFLAMGSATGALAQQVPQPLPSFSLSRFTLNDGGRGGLGAATGDTLPNHRFRASLGIHYENNPLVYYRDTTRIGALVAHRAQLHLGLGFGITSWLQVTAEVPMVIAQTGDDLRQAAGTTAPDGFGLGSTRLAMRVGFLGQGSGGLKSNALLDLALQIGLALPFGFGKALNIESGWNFVPQLSAGADLGPVRVGGELTVLIRRSAALTANTLRDTVGSQFGLRALVSSTSGQNLPASRVRG